MLEGVLLAAIFAAAVIYAFRFWYRAFTGKEQGCTGCPGGCGHGKSCAHLQEETDQDSDTWTRRDEIWKQQAFKRYVI